MGVERGEHRKTGDFQAKGKQQQQLAERKPEFLHLAELLRGRAERGQKKAHHLCGLALWGIWTPAADPPPHPLTGSYLAYFWNPISLGMDSGRMKRMAVMLIVNLRSMNQQLLPSLAQLFIRTGMTSGDTKREVGIQGTRPASKSLLAG